MHKRIIDTLFQGFLNIPVELISINVKCLEQVGDTSEGRTGESTLKLKGLTLAISFLILALIAVVLVTSPFSTITCKGETATGSSALEYTSLGNLPPTASFTYSPDIPMPLETITFDASASYDPDGWIVQYSWNFGDGNVTALANPKIIHYYPMDGNYTVELAVTDNSGSQGVASAVIQVRKVVFFRVVNIGTLTPLSNVIVSVYYNNGSGWSSAPVGPQGLEIKYDLITQPDLANTNGEKYRNPGFTASVLRCCASNIGFDISPSTWEVFFKFQAGSDVAYWPNQTTRVYSYKDGAIEQHDYNPSHQAYWNPATSTYVIKANHISEDGVAPTQSHPIIVGIFCPPQPQKYYLTVKTAPPGITTIPGQGWYITGTNVALTAPTYVNVSPSMRYRFNYWDVDATPQGTGVNPITVGMNSNHTATAHYITQYYLTVSSPYDSPTPVSGWFDSGTGITASVTSPVAGPAGTRYVCTGWAGSGSVPASGSTSSVTFTINAPSSITWTWKTQYQVIFDQTGISSDFAGTVLTIDNSNYARSDLPTSPQFWWDQSSQHSFAFASPLVVNGGKQYVWSSTSGLSTLQGGTLTITTSGNVIGNYIVQNVVTFDQTGVGSDFGGTVVIIDQVSYTWAQLPISFSWGVGTTHSFSFQSPLVVNANAEQYVWTSTTGLSNQQSGSITVTTYGSIIGNYKTQYYLTVSSPYGTTGGQGWYDSGSSAYATVSPLTVPGASGVQYVFTSWSGDASGTTSPSNPITMNSAKTATATWKTQYYLTLATNPPGLPSPAGAGWYYAGTNATISTAAFVDIAPGSSRYRFNGWTTTDMAEITDPTRSPTTVLMDKVKTVTANYFLQYLITFSQSGVGPDFVNAVVKVDGTDLMRASLPYPFWWDNGTTHTFDFRSPLIVTANAKQYVWVSTSGLSTMQSGSVQVSQSGSITGQYKTQFYLTITSPYGVPTGAGWYDSNTSAYVGLGTGVVEYTNRTRRVFTSWGGDASGTNYAQSNPINMNGPKTATANWKTQYLLSVRTDPVGLVPQPTRDLTGDPDSLWRGWWYDASASVQLTAPSTSYWNTALYNFTIWKVYSDGSEVPGNPITVQMNQPHEAVACYKGEPPVGGISVPIIRSTSNVSALLARWMVVTFTLTSTAVATLVFILFKRKRK
jgi:hypothetical protein